MSSELVRRGKALAAAVALIIHLGTRALRALAEASCSVGGELSLGAETFTTLLAVVLLLGKVEAQVVLHGQPVGVRGVADVAVVLPNFVKVLVIGQAASVPIRLTAFLAGKRPPPSLSGVKLLGPGGASRRVGLLETRVAVLDPHHLALGGLRPHVLHLRWARLLEAGTIGASPDQAFGPVLLMKTEVVDELLLDFESFATFLTLVPAGTSEVEETHRHQ